jgi:hypothetical protein
VGDVINEFLKISEVMAPDGTKHQVLCWLCSDLSSTWKLLGIHIDDDSQCPFCDLKDLKALGSPRKSFNAIFDMGLVKDLEATLVFCFPHAWLRLGNQRYDMLWVRAKRTDGRKDKKHSVTALEELLGSCKLLVPSKTKTSDHFSCG